MLAMPRRYLRLVLVSSAVAGGVAPVPLHAQTQTNRGQNLLRVDWADPEIKGYKPAEDRLAGMDKALLYALRMPVIGFGEIPQLVKNIVGPNALPIKRRKIVTDPSQPYWYHLTETYDGISIAIDADRRINQEVGPKFQIGAARKGAAGTLGTPSKPTVSILDSSQEEGMEGLIIEYTVQKFPDIPYTITIECADKVKAQCRDLSVITKDQGLLRVLAPGREG